MKKWICLSLLIIGTNCSNEGNEQALELDGTSWFNYPSHYVDTYPLNLNYTDVFLFDDKELLIVPYSTVFDTYLIKTDSLMWRDYIFGIEMQNKDTLILIPLTEETSELPFLEAVDETNTRYQVKLVNMKTRVDASIVFKSITFSSGACFGECPEMDVEILKSGDFFFKGIEHIDPIGNFKGSLSDSLLQRIMFALQTSSVKEVDNKRGMVDDQVFSLKVILDDDSTYNIGGTVNVQGGLHLLLYELMTLYKKVSLEKSDAGYSFSTKHEIRKR